MHALASFSLAGLDSGGLAYVLLVVFVAAVVRGYSGFGASAIMVTGEVALRTAVFALPLIAGVAIGNRQFLLTSPDSFRRFTLLLLMALASLGLIRGTRPLSDGSGLEGRNLA